MYSYDKFSIDNQQTFIAYLGNSLNVIVYQESVRLKRDTSEIDLTSLNSAYKNDNLFYESTDQRLKALIDALTDKR